MQRRIVGAVLILVATLPVGADVYSGMAAFDRGDYEEAIRQLTPDAQAGDVRAQYYLGRIYADVDGAWHDDARAAEWYGKAAAQGHPVAQTNLGLLYELGRGVDQDDAQAVAWYLEAADQGRAVAQYNLGLLVRDGRGGPAAETPAVEWFRRAAERGHDLAQYMLGQAYELGEGVAPDEARAAKWYRKSAKQGHAPAQLKLAAMYEQGRGVPLDTRKAAKWRAEAAALGLVAAPQPPPEQAAEQQASAPPTPAPAAAGPPSSSAPAPGPPEPPPPPASPPAPAVAAAEPDAGGPAVDELLHPPAVLRWLEAARAGEAEAQYRLGRIYESGDGAKRNLDAAARWYEQAAEQDHGPAAYELAFMKLRGMGGDRRKDFVQAWLWFSVAAELEVGDAAAWRDGVAERMNRHELEEARQLLEHRAASR